ncbi:MAG: addiction module protein [Gammaproteobacteria bacterium]
MAESVDKLFRKALTLSPNERAGLIDELINSLDQPESSIDRKWADEAEDRLRAYRAGELEAYSAEEVFAELGGN